MTDQTPDPEAPGSDQLLPHLDASGVRVLALPAFTDNYLWLLDDGAGHALAIDPGDAKVVETALAAEQLELTAIVLTHHHPDHVGGVEALMARRNIPVFGPHDPRIPANRRLHGGARVAFGGLVLEVLELTGHTRSHLGYFDGQRLFCGDTLFSLGCGRLFEGSAAQMWQALERVMALPPATLICCAHEYTAANLRFARWLFPDDLELAAEAPRIAALRDRGLPTVPSTLAHELALNPFLRMRSSAWRQQLSGLGVADEPVAAFARLRQLKDGFQ